MRFRFGSWICCAVHRCGLVEYVFGALATVSKSTGRGSWDTKLLSVRVLRGCSVLGCDPLIRPLKLGAHECMAVTVPYCIIVLVLEYILLIPHLFMRHGFVEGVVVRRLHIIRAKSSFTD